MNNKASVCPECFSTDIQYVKLEFASMIGTAAYDHVMFIPQLLNNENTRPVRALYCVSCGLIVNSKQEFNIIHSRYELIKFFEDRLHSENKEVLLQKIKLHLNYNKRLYLHKELHASVFNICKVLSIDIASIAKE